MTGDSIDIDMTLGVYRRIYAGFLHGKRINRVSWQAEAWFWRLNAIADDYGNFRADPVDLICGVCPHKQVSPEAATALTDELVAVGLVARYTIANEQFGSIVNFEKWQPAGKNGRRIRRVPADPGESRGIQGNPGESGKSCPPIPIPIPIPKPNPTPTPMVRETPPSEMPWESTSAGPVKDAQAAIFNAYPRKDNRSASVAAITEAAERIAARTNTDVWAGYVWLYNRVRVYAASGLVKSQSVRYMKQCVNWMRDECYDDPPEAWEAPPDPAASAPPRDIGAEAVARCRIEQAERRKRRAEQESHR